MSISSLQSLIQKYGANFGIKPQTASTGDGKGSGTASTSAATSAAGAEKAGDKKDDKKAPASKLDSLDLSPAARDYLSAHTGALGQFELPNMMDYFFSAQDNGDDSGSTGNSLLDYLTQQSDPTQSQSAFGSPSQPGSLADPASRIKSLTDFL